MDNDILLRLLGEEILNQRSVLLLIAMACESPNITTDEIHSTTLMLIKSLDFVI